jgi:uncharacterized protein with HEPN domain
MNRTALQDYFSIENFQEIVKDTQQDIQKSGIDFLMGNKLEFAGILHRCEILGEIAKNLSDNYKKASASIPWNDIAKTRDIITHHYHKIDSEIIKKILQEQIPILLKALPQLKQIAFSNLDPEDQKDAL